MDTLWNHKVFYTPIKIGYVFVRNRTPQAKDTAICSVWSSVHYNICFPVFKSNYLQL